MRFYTQNHKHYCGIDLHAKTMYVCVLDQEGTTLLHRNMACEPEKFLRAVAPYRDDLVVAVECMFTWYWLVERVPALSPERKSFFINFSEAQATLDDSQERQP